MYIFVLQKYNKLNKLNMQVPNGSVCLANLYYGNQTLYIPLCTINTATA